MFYTDQTPVEMWSTQPPTPKKFFYQNGLKWPKMHFGSIFFFWKMGFFRPPHPPTKSGKFQIFLFFFEPFPKLCYNQLNLFDTVPPLLNIILLGFKLILFSWSNNYPQLGKIYSEKNIFAEVFIKTRWTGHKIWSWCHFVEN